MMTDRQFLARVDAFLKLYQQSDDPDFRRMVEKDIRALEHRGLMEELRFSNTGNRVTPRDLPLS